MIMDRLKELIEQMSEEMRAALIKDGEIASPDGMIGDYDEKAIRIAVYEDINDTLKHLMADVIYND